MQPFELSQLTITPAEADADLEAWSHVFSLVTPDAHPAVENLRFDRDSKERLTATSWPASTASRLPVGTSGRGARSPRLTSRSSPSARRHGIGSALLAEISNRARGLDKDILQGEVRESDTESRAFVERRSFVQVGAEKALVLELDGIEAPEVEPPPGIRIVSRVEEPDRLQEMYAVSVQADEDIPGATGVQTFEGWRAQEIDKPDRRADLCFLAVAGDEVVGYAALQAHGEKAFHGLTATRRDWRRRGVATALKRAEIAAAKRAGFERLLTESEERNEPMRRLNEKLGFVPAPEWSMVVMRGPLA